MDIVMDPKKYENNHPLIVDHTENNLEANKQNIVSTSNNLKKNIKENYINKVDYKRKSFIDNLDIPTFFKKKRSE